MHLQAVGSLDVFLSSSFNSTFFICSASTLTDAYSREKQKRLPIMMFCLTLGVTFSGNKIFFHWTEKKIKKYKEGDDLKRRMMDGNKK